MPNDPTSSKIVPKRPPCRHAFTLVELTVAIGIIVILIALLIPTVSKIRTASYSAATRQEVGQIAAACGTYFQDFRAYPGPVSNTDIETMSIDTTSLPYKVTQPNINIYYSASPAGSQSLLTQIALWTSVATNYPVGGYSTSSTLNGLFSGAENLVLGLCGGLWRNPNNKDINGNPILEFVNGSSPTITNPVTLIGTGPQSLAIGSSNGQGNKQYTAYIPVAFPGSKLMLNGDGSPENGTSQYHDFNGRIFGDCYVPVFTDQFPDAMPILYLRARVGAHGVISGPGIFPSGGGNPWSGTTNMVTDPTITGSPIAHYNYDISDILPYTLFTAGLIETPPSTGSPPVTQPPNPYGHGLEAVGDQQPTSGGTFGAMPWWPVAANNLAGNVSNQGYDKPVPNNYLFNAGEYFINPSVSPGFVTPTSSAGPPAVYSINTQLWADKTNATGTPRAKDEFIIITAGPDRTYGTADDITSFGDVEP